MPLFQHAGDFTLDGTFQDVNGDQHNHTHDHSFNIQGDNNQTTLSPNHSRTENRISNHIRGVNIQGVVSPGGQNYIGIQHQTYSPPSMNWDQFPMDLFLAFLAANPQLQSTQNGGFLSPSFQQNIGPHDTQQPSQPRPPLSPYQSNSTNHQGSAEHSLPRPPGSPPGSNELLAPSPLFPDPALLGLGPMTVQPLVRSPLDQAPHPPVQSSTSELYDSPASTPQTLPSPSRGGAFCTRNLTNSAHPPVVIPPPCLATATPSTKHLSVASSITLPSDDSGMDGIVTLASTTTPPPSTAASQVVSITNATPVFGTPTPLPIPSYPVGMPKNATLSPFLSGLESDLPDRGTLKEGDYFSLFKPPDPSKRGSTVVSGIPHTGTEQGIETRGTSGATTRKKKRGWLERLGLKKVKARNDTNFS